GDHAAFETPARQALLDQRAGDQQQAALGVHQAVFQLRVHVQRLVGGDGPGGGGPDDGKRRLVQSRQAEGGGESFRLGGREHHVQRLALLVLVFDLELGQRR